MYVVGRKKMANHMRGSGGRGSGPHLENNKAIGFLSNTGLDPLKNYRSIKPAFSVRPLSVRQRNAILMVRVELDPL